VECTVLDGGSLKLIKKKSDTQDLWDEINEEYALGVRGISHLIRFGTLLNTLKAIVPHGRFGKMLKANAPFSWRTANYWMQIARSPNSQRIANMTLQKVLSYDRVQKRARQRLKRRKLAPPDKVPRGTEEDYARSVEVSQLMADFVQHVRDYDPVQVARGAVGRKSELRKLKANALYIHEFIIKLREELHGMHLGHSDHPQRNLIDTWVAIDPDDPDIIV
jgi:hypothetical protein